KPIKSEREKVVALLENLSKSSANGSFISDLKNKLSEQTDPLKSEMHSTARKDLRYVVRENSDAKANLLNWISEYTEKTRPDYSSHLHSESEKAAVKIEAVEPEYAENAEMVDARLVLRDNFDKILETIPETLV